MHLQDILSAIPWGFLLAFTIGPVFFVLLETSITKGFKAALLFDFGVVFGDVLFIFIAYFSTNQILEKLKDDPELFFFGGAIMLIYGIYSFIIEKKKFKKKQLEKIELASIQKTNYLGLFFKGFFLNFINVGVLVFWMGIIIVFGPKMNMEVSRIVTFIMVVLITYLVVDILKILVAKQLKSRLTPYYIYKIKRVISVILMIFGFFIIIQGFFPKEKELIEKRIEKFKG